MCVPRDSTDPRNLVTIYELWLGVVGVIYYHGLYNSVGDLCIMGWRLDNGYITAQGTLFWI